MAALELPGGTGGGQFQLNLPVRLPVRSLTYNPVVLGCAAHCSPFGRSLHRLTEGTPPIYSCTPPSQTPCPEPPDWVDAPESCRCQSTDNRSTDAVRDGLCLLYTSPSPR